MLVHTATVVTVLAVSGCAVALEESEAEAASVGGSALSVGDEGSPPPARTMPRMAHPGRPPIWDLEPYFDELNRQPKPMEGRCSLHYYKLYDPVRGVTVEVPVTICP